MRVRCEYRGGKKNLKVEVDVRQAWDKATIERGVFDQLVKRDYNWFLRKSNSSSVQRNYTVTPLDDNGVAIDKLVIRPSMGHLKR